MIKKLSLGTIALFMGYVAFSQTIVSTSPENKNVVLEEFTGIHCQYCPEGHTIAQALLNANPGRVSLINVHAGGYAVPGPGEPDFRTPWGQALVNQAFGGPSQGFPSGTINRHSFPGRHMYEPGETAMGRGSWTVSANEILTQPSYVNVGVEASINVQTRQLTVHVEAYYTGNSPKSTNKLNVALVQNNTKGPQTGGNKGNNYNHMHRLVDLLTGQWGETIPTTTTGTFVDKTYTYTIPADYKGVPALLEDMEVVAFITETTQEIPTGQRALPTFTGLIHANDAEVTKISPISPVCMNSVAPVVTIKNMGNNDLTSLVINYDINGTTHTYNWSGNLSSLQKEDVALPAGNFTLQPINTVTVTLPNDDDNSNNSQTLNFEEALEATGTIDVTIVTDRWGYQFKWELLDSNGTIVHSGKNYANSKIYQMRLNLSADCYTLVLHDTGKDGGTRFIIKDTDKVKILDVMGNWGEKHEAQFSSNGVLGVGHNQLSEVAIYPNPTNSILNIAHAENADIKVYDMLGRMILSQNNISVNQEINVSGLSNGTYFIQISKQGNTATNKFIIAK